MLRNKIGVLKGNGLFLPDYDSKSVAVIIPSLRLDLEMLPHHVEAGLFHFLDVKDPL